MKATNMTLTKPSDTSMAYFKLQDGTNSTTITGLCDRDSSQEQCPQKATKKDFIPD